MADPENYMATADVWAVLDLIVAEWTSDPRSVECFDSRLRARAAQLAEAHTKRRQDNADLPFVDMTEAIAAWLDSKGWRPVVMSDPSVDLLWLDSKGWRPVVMGDPSVDILGGDECFGRYLFTLRFTGGKKRDTPPSIIIPGNGGEGPH